MLLTMLDVLHDNINIIGVDRDMNIVGQRTKMYGWNNRCGQRHEHCGTENKSRMDGHT